MKMNKIHDLSQITTLADLDIFTVPPTQLSIEKNLVTEHRPISVLSPTSQIEFNINPGIDEYIQLKDTLLYMKIKVDIQKATNVIDADWKNISPVNNLLHSLFRAVDIEINGKSVTLNPQTYAYKAYFETNLGYSHDAQASHLSSSGYYVDYSHKSDFGDAQSKLIRPETTSTDGSGKSIELIGKLFLDLAQQPKALLGGTKVKITLVPNDPRFYIWTKDDAITPIVTFENASLFVTRSKVNSDIVEAHNLALMKGNAKYPLTRGNVKSFTISSGQQDINIDNAINGQIPRRIFVALVTNKAFIGDLKSNPYEFKDFGVNYITASIDGTQYPSIPHTPNFSKGLCMREYLSVYEALNQLSTDATFYVARQYYKSGNVIYGFNFGPDPTDECYKVGYVNPIKHGSLGLNIKFDTALTETINVLIYCEYDNLLQITANREAITDYL